MPKSDNQKLKILYIYDYLLKNSHENKPVRAAELIQMLENCGISCDRKTVYSDIAALQDYGLDIVTLPGRNGGYYVASRIFELPELKLLIDAVQSSRYLTEKKSMSSSASSAPSVTRRMPVLSGGTSLFPGGLRV